jgi:hypothetical protein
MVPYIAALIVLIVAVLFAVYARVDGFSLQALTVSESTKVETLVDFLDRYITLNKDLIKTLKAGTEFDEELTPEKATELGLAFTPSSDGKLAVGINKPLSDTLRKQIEVDLLLLESINTQVQKKLASGEIRKAMTLKEALKGQTMDPVQTNQVLTKQINLVNAREAYIQSKGKPTVPNQTDSSGVSLEDIFGGFRKAIRASTLDQTQPVQEEPDAAPTTSEVSTKEMEERIAKNVATQVKDSLLAQRATQPVDAMPCPYAAYDSNATAQGQEYTQAKPDMSQYIRKDSIPCWNCSLP